MRRLIKVLITAVLLIGCKAKTPAGIIEPDRMQKILYDIHVADGYVSTIAMPDSAKKVASSYYKGIYKKFGTDSAEYTRSMNYYYANPAELDKIYKNIFSKLEMQKKMMEKADSLQKVKLKKTKPELQKAPSVK